MGRKTLHQRETKIYWKHKRKKLVIKSEKGITTAQKGGGCPQIENQSFVGEESERREKKKMKLIENKLYDESNGGELKY